MLFVFIILVLRITDMCDAHVYCQDMHSTSWTPLGYSCPVNCPSVHAAINKLTELDYDNMFNMQQNVQFMNISDDSVEYFHRRNYGQGSIIKLEPLHNLWNVDTRTDDPGPAKGNTRPKISHFHDFYKMLHNDRALRDVQTLFKSSSARYNNKSCRVVKQVMRGKKNDVPVQKMFEKCVRRSDVEKEFVQKFTAILNKFTGTEQPFTESLTSMMLEKILGPSMDLRHGFFDVQKILKFLRHVLNEHKIYVKKRGTIIKLTSKFCMNLYVPGCFCIPGFVERDGECVSPAECFPDQKLVSDYLERVIVN